MLGDVATVMGALPETRARLFDAACRVMLPEPNDRHDVDPHAHHGEDELLLAAGAICAAQVLCGVGGVHTGSRRNTPDDCLRLADIATLPFGECASLAVKTRLFPADDENRFTHVHRVVAEYLGAKWLVRCFENGISEKRIFALFRQGEGVPTSLRGLHAWMAHFSEALSRRCIEADPYAVLRYGDAETLGLNQARALLAALKKLSEEDPYFRSEDWERHPARGLMRPELRDDWPCPGLVDTSPARPSRTNASRSMTAARSCIDSSTPSVTGRPMSCSTRRTSSPASPPLKCRSRSELAWSSRESSPISPPARPVATTAPAHRRSMRRKRNPRPPHHYPHRERARKGRHSPAAPRLLHPSTLRLPHMPSRMPAPNGVTSTATRLLSHRHRTRQRQHGYRRNHVNRRVVLPIRTRLSTGQPAATSSWTNRESSVATRRSTFPISAIS